MGPPESFMKKVLAYFATLGVVLSIGHLMFAFADFVPKSQQWGVLTAYLAGGLSLLALTFMGALTQEPAISLAGQNNIGLLHLVGIAGLIIGFGGLMELFWPLSVGPKEVGNFLSYAGALVVYRSLKKLLKTPAT